VTTIAGCAWTATGSVLITMPLARAGRLRQRELQCGYRSRADGHPDDRGTTFTVTQAAAATCSFRLVHQPVGGSRRWGSWS
jgi:hypothetical protein